MRCQLAFFAPFVFYSNSAPSSLRGDKKEKEYLHTYFKGRKKYANGPRDNKEKKKASRQKLVDSPHSFSQEYWKSNFLCGHRLLSRILLEINLSSNKKLPFIFIKLATTFQNICTYVNTTQGYFSKHIGRCVLQWC
jgi:hypothetical protein